MNYCRTCKYWAANAHAIGLGTCINMDMFHRVIGLGGSLATAQDFGCVLHQSGYCAANLYPPDEAEQIVQDFLKAPRPTK